MSKIISIIRNKKYLSDTKDDTLYEIYYYNDISYKDLIIIGVIDGWIKCEVKGEALVKHNIKFGCINHDGKVIVPLITTELILTQTL